MAASTALQVIVSPFVGVVFDNLSSLIQKEVGLIWGVDREIRKLTSTLSTIRNVLEDAEERQITDKAVADWLLKLKNLAYDADDILDEWETEARQLHLGTEHVTCSKQVCVSYFSCFNFKQVMFRREIAKKLNSLGERFNDIALEKSSFHLREGIAGRRLEHYPNRETSSLLTDPHVYGRDEEKKFILRLLLGNEISSEPVSVYPIVGIGGLGKTTLAQYCYNDPGVKDRFDVQVWVCVYDDFNVKRLTKAILVSMGEDARNIEELDPLQRLLQEKLAQKRFLIVLDDVWNENQEEWSKFKSSLNFGARGSSVIVTTRLMTVASIRSTMPHLSLSYLSVDDCWSLFRQHAFGIGNEERVNLVQIGKEIVKKCGGVPLTAKVLGSLMRFIPDEKEWLFVRDSSIWDLPQSDGNTILPTLRLSYSHLDPHLRQCFAYCSIFPKDYLIVKGDLIRLWMANGFIESNGEMQLEDIGKGIFNALCWRSFLQEESKYLDGLIVSCKMHDLVHDLACSINENECYHLAEGRQITNINLETRHLSVRLGTHSLSLVRSIPRLAPNLRTLILLDYDDIECIPTDFNLLYLRSLRVLKLEHIGLLGNLVRTTIVDSLGSLKHLRYLKLSGIEIASLPESLCKLSNLRSLELEDCQNLRKLPKGMRYMSSLRHLKIGGCDKLQKMPIEMGKLSCLQTLGIFVVGTNSGRRIKELQGIDNLSGELEIKKLELVKNMEEAKGANMKRKENLFSLKLVWSDSDLDGGHHMDVIEGLQPHSNLRRLSIERFKGPTFPSWLEASLLPHLVEISLRYCKECEHFPSSLGKLSLLKRLVATSMDSVKFFSTGNAIANDFPSLEDLYLNGMPQLEEWSLYTGNSEQVNWFPNLKILNISGCPKLKRLPHSPLSLLERLYLSNNNPAILESLKNLPQLSSLNFCNFFETTSFPQEMLQNLPSLECLHINYCNALQSLPQNLSSLKSLDISSCDAFRSLPQNLSSLKSLRINYCNALQSLPQNLSSLKSLDIIGCDALQSLPDLGSISLEKLWIQHCESLSNPSPGLRCETTLHSLLINGCPKAKISTTEYQHLTSLTSLILDVFPDMTSLPNGLQHLSSTLRTLHILEWSALNSLPAWIGTFTNLEDLSLHSCKNLRDLPDELKNLTNLRSLTIGGCHPELHGRCEKETGEAWPKIAHIPRIRNIQALTETPKSALNMELRCSQVFAGVDEQFFRSL